ncbi:MAG: hypothetical protein J6Y96_00285, partial [Mycoplasma sp.]|nr:hypothetical protein [Mycoplasma sp.]
KYFYKISAFSVVANEDEFNNLNVELKKKIKTYYGTYKNDEVAGVALTQSQNDYKNFININNENNWIKDFYEGYYHVLSWIMIFLGAIVFFLTMLVLFYSKFNKEIAVFFANEYMPDIDKWKTYFWIIFIAFDAIIIFIGEFIMFLKTLWT